MRKLNPEEAKKVEAKLRKYVGNNVDSLLNPSCVLALQGQRVFYVGAELYKMAAPFPRDSIVAVGICLGRFTRSEVFRLKVTALPVLVTYCTDKVKVKAAAEMHYVYGNHVQRSQIQSISSDTRKNTGVLVLSSTGVPLGFGITSKHGTEVVNGDKKAVLVVRQGDTGEYLRDEQALM